MIRYRTETFSGLQERDIVDVMTFETFEMGNTDILETLRDGVLKGNPICDKFDSVIYYLESDKTISFELDEEGQRAFFEDIVSEINKVTGLELKYCLWLGDIESVSDKSFYGRDIQTADDIDSYETGPVILSDIDSDGTLYGYTEMPVSIEEKRYDVEDKITDILNQLKNEDLSDKETKKLNDRFQKLYNELQYISDCILNKEECFNEIKGKTTSTSLSDKIQDSENFKSNQAYKDTITTKETQR